MALSSDRHGTIHRLIPHSLLQGFTYSTLALLLFPLIYTIEGAFRTNYNPLAQTISSLSFGPTGWTQRLNFILLGATVIWLATLWYRLLRKSLVGIWYPAVRAIEGLGLIAVGLFTQDPQHTVFLVVLVVAMALALLIMTFYFWAVGLKSLAVFSLLCFVWLNIGMPLFGIALYGHGILTDYAGLFERLATNADTIWAVGVTLYFWKQRNKITYRPS